MSGANIAPVYVRRKAKPKGVFDDEDDSSSDTGILALWTFFPSSKFVFRRSEVYDKLL